MSDDLRYRPRPLVCGGCGRVIGLITRRADRSRRLHVLRNTQAVDAPMPALNFATRWAVVNHVGKAEIYCDFCGAVREWHVGQDAIEQLIKAKR